MEMEGFVKGIMAQAESAHGVVDGDYQKDGLWYCGKCNTPKQCVAEFFFGTRKPFCLCDCAKAKQAAEEAALEREKLQRQIAEYRKMGFPESKMQSWTFQNADGSNAKIMAAAKRYAEQFEGFLRDGKGLLMFGTVGTGKTYTAACIANALIDQGRPALVTNFARIANTVGGMFEGKQAYYDSLSKFNLLVLDDLNAERKTEYMQEIVYNVIDSRYRAGLPIIVTTNLTWQELVNPSDVTYQRIFSRLLEMCIPVKFEGEDKRLQGVRESLAEAKQYLGL